MDTRDFSRGRKHPILLLCMIPFLKNSMANHFCTKLVRLPEHLLVVVHDALENIEFIIPAGNIGSEVVR